MGSTAPHVGVASRTLHMRIHSPFQALKSCFMRCCTLHAGSARLQVSRVLTLQSATAPACLRSRRLHTSTVCMAKPWRPRIDDVDRLSKGDGAKVRGTGSRDIPHRLNADERPVYESAKKKVRRWFGARAYRQYVPVYFIHRASGAVRCNASVAHAYMLGSRKWR